MHSSEFQPSSHIISFRSRTELKTRHSSAIAPPLSLPSPLAVATTGSAPKPVHFGADRVHPGAEPSRRLSALSPSVSSTEGTVFGSSVTPAETATATTTATATATAIAVAAVSSSLHSRCACCTSGVLGVSSDTSGTGFELDRELVIRPVCIDSSETSPSTTATTSVSTMLTRAMDELSQPSSQPSPLLSPMTQPAPLVGSSKPFSETAGPISGGGGSGLTAKESKPLQMGADSRDPDCAICLDRIQPRRHAKAILACRHEFHLSCISMAFAMGKEMICPLCRYLHKDQPFMGSELEDTKPTSSSPARSTAAYQHHLPQRHPISQASHTSMATLHEHPTSGTVLSMMPSLFETSLGHGPTAGTVRISPEGICLKTSTWLMLYAMPFSVALIFLAFVLGKVETMWSKVSCLIGAAICYMVCWALMVAIMDPDHEARAILERLDQMHGATDQRAAEGDSLVSATDPLRHANSGEVQASVSTPSSLVPDTFPTRSSSWGAWVQQRYARNIQDRITDLAGILDDVPDMMGEW